VRSIEPDILRKLLRYEPDTGRLFWLPRGVEWFRDFPRRSALQVCNTWNTRYAGKEAFTASAYHGHKIGAVLNVFVPAHRVAWAIHYGVWPTAWIDHISGDASDNRITNLRLVTAVENRRNCARSRRNKSGANGVRWHPQMQKWHAQIGAGRRNRHLGFFDSFDEALSARAEADKHFGFHPNHGREPKQMEV